MLTADAFHSQVVTLCAPKFVGAKIWAKRVWRTLKLCFAQTWHWTLFEGVDFTSEEIKVERLLPHLVFHRWWLV